jgi:hypothetical protein
MSTQPPLSPQPDAPPPAVALFPLSVPPPDAPVAEASAADPPAGGARKLSRWEEQEQLWFPEDTDFSHSGINE